MNFLISEAGEMLHVAEAFIDKNYHPTVICRGKIEITFILILFCEDCKVV